MEKKTTQRIVGILVVIALVIILMPLLLDKNDAATQTASVKAPPFPDQPPGAPPLTVAAEDKNAPSSIYISPEIADKINKVASAASKPIQQVIPEATQREASAQPAAPQPAEPTAPVAKSVAEVSPPSTVTPATPTPAVTEPKFQTASAAEEVKSVEEPTITTTKTPAPKMKVASKTDINWVKPKHVITTASAAHTKQTVKHVKIMTASAAHAKHKAQPVNMENLKKVAWAVQLGSFKNKDNARRLADRLRVAGYKAFMHDVKSAKGSTQTRVYIGPEYKQASAAKLSMQLEQKLKMRGFIVPYKPLEL